MPTVKPCRRSIKVWERCRQCEICTFSITERAHILEVSMYSENEWTKALCPNCHTVYDLVYRAMNGSNNCDRLLNAAKDRNAHFSQLIYRCWLLAKEKIGLDHEIERQATVVIDNHEAIKNQLRSGVDLQAIAAKFDVAPNMIAAVMVG